MQLYLYGVNITGRIPESFSHLTALHELDMGYSNLAGPIPKPLWNLTHVESLSLSDNHLEGSISQFSGFGKLKRLSLRNNNFDGQLDLRSNKLHGPIKSSGNRNLFAQLQIMDLSSNGFSGNLPESLLGNLHAMKKINEKIPLQLASLTFLEVLNLSHNHLVGCIPKGKQFDTFENSSYQGNDGLRGLPLSKHCGGDGRVPQEEEEEDSPIISWQAVLMGYGCGLVIGVSIIYIMLSTQYPTWFSRFVVQLEHKITTRMKRNKKRY
ncbi:hypothetical protein R3W88_000102 [Solanum pinnatisectum]|uniref:Uncharacterized protein n=1 Tax=Solanum pinnatisectum TaxID=50273 RepID=A0AAV9MEF5_9SOLN|nr:hypothetical protein R3W88_000102 [Solanum pinnatisectum]